MLMRQPKVVLKVSQVPDWGRRAIRLSLALVFFTTIAITLWPVPVHLREEWGDEVRQTCNWAAASCAVVAASPLIGKVAQLSYERTLGTLTGGLLGYLVYDFGVLQLSDLASDILMVVAAAAVGALSCYLSYKFSLDASMRLFVITFLIVVFGGGTHSALGVALLRTGGIITGVLLFMGLTVVILPKSATIEALREMKSGLKLLTELNTLVWTSRQEAEAALKAAADKARASELAAAAAATAAAKAATLATAAGVTAAGSSWPGDFPSSKAGLWRSLTKALGFVAKSQQVPAHYSHLPDCDPEMGAGALPTGAADSAGGASNGTIAGVSVSHLTSALRSSSNKGAGDHAAGKPWGVSRQQSQLRQRSQHLEQPQQQQQLVQQQDQKSFKQFMDEYEERCEAVLTKVYQSMFKVKEHMQLSESELYVYHFCGHYMFLPMFFNKKLCNWLFPRRWRLPAADLEEVSTGIRVIARLLWTVHMDFSQECFDEVIQALPAAAGMSNLLLELAARTSACLGVLVEAFPNKEAVLVDHLRGLEALISRMLEVSSPEDQHKALIRELAANRPVPARPHRATPFDSTAAASLPADHPIQQQQQQQQQQGLPGWPERSGFSGFSDPSFESRPAAAAVAAVAAGRDTHTLRTASTALAAARLGVDLLSPRTSHHLMQQQQQQGAEDTPRQEVWFVTYHDPSDDAMPIVGVSSSLAVDGLGPPIPAQSPELWSPHAAPPSGVAALCTSTGAAWPTASAPSQGELIFDMTTDSPRAAAAAAAAAAAEAGSSAAAATAAADGSSSSVHPAAAGTPAAAGSAQLPQPFLGRSESRHSSSSLGQSTSFIRSHFKPLARAPTLCLNRPAGTPAGQHRLSGPGQPGSGPGSVSTGPVGQAGSGPGEAGALGYSRAGEAGTGLAASKPGGWPKPGALSFSRAAAAMRSVSAPDQAAADAAVALLQGYRQQQEDEGGLEGSQPQQQQELQQQVSKQGQLQHWQQQQQQAAEMQAQQGGEGPASAGGLGESGMSLVLQALNDPEIMSFAKLTRWYSFQFLMMELLMEIDELYHGIRKVLTTLPHGL